MKPLDITAYGREGLADYACHTNESRGRLFAEPDSPTRTHFQRDRDRIIHSTAFRRLKHKTQVFVHHVGDHYRTRLTHSIEVSQIARSLARALQVDEDLAESLALSHDFGHTPFGHVGEDVLNELMSRYGGFDHNAQSLRIVTMLEQQYAEFDGLNLCWETLEGLVKHNGPVTGDIPQTFIDFNEKWDLELGSHASIEAQCAAVADDIAYNAHDLDDGLRAGLFKLDDLSDVPLAGEALSEVFRKYPELEEHRIRHEIVRRQITAMVEDVITNAKSNLADLQPKSVSDVRNFGKTVVCFSDDMHAKEKGIKAFLFDKMYRSPNVMIMRDGAERIIRNLFDVYLNETGDMPNGLQRLSLKNKSNDRPRIIADFIAGMTDSYAISEHERMFDETPDLG
jgi:dGTPase